MAIGGASIYNSSSSKDAARMAVASNSSCTARESLLLFPLQFTCSDVASEALSDAQSPDQYDPVVEVQKIQRALGSLTDAEVQLAAAVQEAKASSMLSTGTIDLRAVGSYLRSRHGYLVSLRHANGSRRPNKAYLRQLRHDFLVVRGLPGIERMDVLVDLNFHDHFRVAHDTPWYAKMLAALPQDWVGTAAALAPIVGLMSAGIRLCFRAAGIPLPPWREGRAMLSKWVSELHSDEALPMVPLPDPALRRLLAPYHTPFRTAVQQAGGSGGGSGVGSEGSSAGSSSSAGAGTSAHLSILGWDKDRPGQQQQQHAHPKQQQQQHPAGLPPLPAATAGAAAAAAAAAAAHLGKEPVDQNRQQQQHHHHHVACDVPRKIIVGFPVASLPTLDPHLQHNDQQQQQQQLWGQQQQQQADQRSQLGEAAGNSSSSTTTRAVKLQHGHQQGHQLQQQQAGCAAVFVAQQQQQQQQQPRGSSSNAPGSQALPQQETASATAAAAAAGTVAVARSAAAAARPPGSALAQLDPSSSQQRSRSSAQNTAAAAAAAAPAGPAAHVVRPAFSSTAGVVVTVGSSTGTSPSIGVSKQWVVQLTEGAMAVGSDKGRAAAMAAAGAAAPPPPAAAAAATAASGGGASAGAGCHGGAVPAGGSPGEAGAGSGTAATAAAAAVRHFKSLDQLLPRMRTVKLGAG